MAATTRVVKFIQKGETGAKGAALRGPLDWSDCAVGFEFQAGGDGEDFYDVVIYEDNYYYCKTAHTKTATNYPLSDASESNNLWALGDKFGVVATNLLLTAYALIKNLGVEVIDMKDSDGNIIFQAKDGAVTCNIGNFDNITVTNAILKNLNIQGSTKIDYITEADAVSGLVTLYPRSATRLRLSNQNASAYIADVIEQGVYESADAEGHEIEIFLKSSVFGTRVSSPTVITSERNIVDYAESGSGQETTYSKITIDVDYDNILTDAVVAGGYIRLVFADNRWEAVQKTGNIILTN